jgi:hypothetical protein
MYRMIWPVIGDGHCAFRSVAQGVSFATNGYTLDQEAETLKARVLRVKVVEALEAKQGEKLKHLGDCTLRQVSANPTRRTQQCIV